MINQFRAAPIGRRWGSLVFAIAASALIAGCASTSGVGPQPPTQCNRSKARPINIYGSLLQEVPAQTKASADVMIFEEEGPAPNPSEQVPAVKKSPPQSSARIGRPLALSSTNPSQNFGSC